MVIKKWTHVQLGGEHHVGAGIVINKTVTAANWFTMLLIVGVTRDAACVTGLQGRP